MSKYINVKNNLIADIEAISYNVEKQVEEYIRYGVGASVTELIETWFDFMPRIIVDMIEEKDITIQEAKLLIQFNEVITDISRKLDYKVKSEDVFRSDPNWAKLREKAKEIYEKLQKVKS